ncbi:MAG: type VII secretion protein EssC, partial [Defluviitaleaceae bacterium]|nr:type VII secretion protein EssC [Defluviitaleaceae bacterium]
MVSLVIFDNNKVVEYSADVNMTEITHLGEGEKQLIGEHVGALYKPEAPLYTQIGFVPNVPIAMGTNLRIMFAVGKRPLDSGSCYSTMGKNPIRIGNHPGDHIYLPAAASSLAIYPGKLHVMDGEDVYHNGAKLQAGEYKIAFGDMLWVNAVKIIYHDNYVECTGRGFATNLNVSTQAHAAPAEFPIYKRSPRIIKRTPTDEVELRPPPQKEKKKKWELLRVVLPPLLTSSVMVGGSMLLGRGLFVLIGAASMLVSLVFSTTMFISDRKEKRRKTANRENNYGEYLLGKRKEIHKLYESQRESLLYHNLIPAQIEREVLNYSPRIYERAANDGDFLTLSLGTSSIPISFKVKYEADAKLDADEIDPLETEMRELGGMYKDIDGMPQVVDLKNAHLGIVGEKTYIHRQLTSLLLQLCFYQSYHDIEVITLLEEEHREAFEWIRWFPHCKIKNINVTGLISAENHRDQALGNVAQVLKMRKQKQDEEKKEARFLPHYVFIIDNPKLIINHSIMEYLQAADTTLGFSLIYTTHLQANLPENVKTVQVLTGGDNAILVMEEGVLMNTPATLPAVGAVEVESVSRRLAPLIHNQGVSTQIPESVTFFELYGVKKPEELPVLELWQKNACHKSLAVPLGLRGKDDIVALNLHEKAHGPHGLVAGTTGSGKSEIVQSYILSLAVNFHPHEVGFLLIDYKGGGMANLFSDLPHLLGTITNLDGSESMRALASVKSELAKRQRIFNDHDVNNINQYTQLFKAGDATIPMPHLFIISDEFAELKKEQPEFMSELVSTARIGRSLGVHLILATQKPSGVVDDQIWSNSKFKLALKVANESDSNEVLKTPDAARITQPGRSYLQVGNNEIYELFQSAYSGAAYSETVVEKGFDSRVYLINRLGQGELLNEDLSTVDTAEDSRLSQLDVTVTYIQLLYDLLRTTPVDKPWLPPLSDHIVTPHIHLGTDVGKISSASLTIPLGMVDIPEEQNQVEYVYDFTQD